MKKMILLNSLSFSHVIKLVIRPVWRELPFIIIFMVLMGCLNVMGMIHGRMLSPDDYASTFEMLCWMAEMFLVAYMMATIILLSKRNWVRVTFYTLAVVLFAVQTFLKLNFNWMITPAVLSMMAETNVKESSEFLNSFLFAPQSKRVYLIITLAILSIVVAEYIYGRFVRERMPNKAVQFVLSIITVTSLTMGFCSLHCYAPLFDNHETLENLTKRLENRFSVSPLSRTFFSIGILNASNRYVRMAVDMTKNISGCKLQANATDSLSVIFVIGESYIKWHSHLYGYPLHTTPMEDKELDAGNLFVFNDVITPFNHTSESIKNIFSTNSLGDGENWTLAPFFPAIFRKAGYEVMFWDNQKSTSTMFDTWSFTLDSFLYDDDISQSSYTMTNNDIFPYDESLIDDYRKKVRTMPRRSLVIFHLMGQHLEAAERYPHNKMFSHFTADSIKRTEPWLTREKKKRIAEYDNATLYNDYVLGKVFNLFRNKNAVLVYLPDHGEEVYDFRDGFGRDHGKSLQRDVVKYQYEIPFVVWCSDKFKQRNPNIVNAIKGATSRPLMADNVSQLLIGLGQISTQYYKSSRDVINCNYKCPKRLIRGYYDYDRSK